MWEGVVWSQKRRRSSLDLEEEGLVDLQLEHGEEGLVDLQLEHGGQKCPGQILLHHNHLSSSTLVESIAPHPAGEPGCLDGLAGVLGKIWATAL